MTWIISRRADLIWFHGSVAAGLVLLALFVIAPLTGATYSPTHPAVLALLVWGVVFDGTHVFGMYARTYLAPTRDPALPGNWSWLLVGVGPAIAVIDHYVCAQGPSLLAQAGWLFRNFLLFAYLWAYWHLVRQHYGFLALYRRRGGLTDTREAQLETLLLWVGCLFPYVRFALSDGYVRSGLPLLIPLSWLPALRTVVDIVAALSFVIVATALARRTRSLGPRHLLLAIVIGFHCAVFALLDNLLTITAALTIFHNLQYHRIVWQHEGERGRVPARTLGRYLALGLLLGAVWYVPRTFGVAFTHSDLARNVLLGVGWGVAFHHYYVDGKIWRRPKKCER